MASLNPSPREQRAPSLSDIVLAKTPEERTAILEAIAHLKKKISGRSGRKLNQDASSEGASLPSPKELKRLHHRAKYLFLKAPRLFSDAKSLAPSECNSLIETLRGHRNEFWKTLYSIPAIYKPRIAELERVIRDKKCPLQEIFTAYPKKHTAHSARQAIRNALQNVRLLENQDPSGKEHEIHDLIGKQLMRVPPRPEVALSIAAATERALGRLTHGGVHDDAPLEVVASKDLKKGAFLGLDPTALTSADSPRIQEMREHRERYITIKNYLFTANSRLIFLNSNLEARHDFRSHDREQHAFIGILRAIERFNPASGYRFSTFATHCIKTSEMLGAEQWGDTVAGGSNYSRLKIREHLNKTIHEVTPAEIASLLNVSEELAASLLRVAPGASKLPHDLLDCPSYDPSKLAVVREYREIVSWNVARLPERERFIVTNFFGLNGGPPVTLSDIGAQLGFSKQRAQQLLSKALKELRPFLSKCEERTEG